MRVLFISQYVPYPPNSGTRIRAYYLLQRLARYGPVTLLHYTRSDAESAQAEALRPFCEHIVSIPLRRSRSLDIWRLVRSLFMRTPFFILRDDSRFMRRAVFDLANEMDFGVVHADQLNMAQFAELVGDAARVVDNHNVLLLLLTRMSATEPNPIMKVALRVDAAKMRSYERKMFTRFDAVLAASEPDAREIRGLGGEECKPVVVPIGIDCEAMTPILRKPGATDILSVASMGYPPNEDGLIWFVRPVFPLVSERLPGIKLRIVGDKPGRKVQALTADASVVVTGYVEDLQSVVAQSAVFVVPLRSGSGMRVKILNAFAQGIPVVSTTIGCEGIDAIDGEHLLLADTPEAFRDAVIRVIQSPVLGDHLVRSARRLVESSYSWQTVYSSLDPVYDRLAALRAKVSGL